MDKWNTETVMAITITHQRITYRSTTIPCTFIGITSIRLQQAKTYYERGDFRNFWPTPSCKTSRVPLTQCLPSTVVKTPETAIFLIIAHQHFTILRLMPVYWLCPHQVWSTSEGTKFSPIMFVIQLIVTPDVNFVHLSIHFTVLATKRSAEYVRLIRACADSNWAVSTEVHHCVRQVRSVRTKDNW